MRDLDIIGLTLGLSDLVLPVGEIEEIIIAVGTIICAVSTIYRAVKKAIQKIKDARSDKK